jgi:DNA invertase Pin-like site-specific DNA recombinase
MNTTPIRSRVCRALIDYRRLSVKRQQGRVVEDVSESIDRQGTHNTARAARDGHTIAFTLIDDGKSAYDLSVVREGWETALELIRTGQADGIIAWNTDRYTRQPEDGLRLMRAAREAGVPVLVGDGSKVFDFTDSTDEFMFLVECGLTKKSSADTQRRVLDVKDTARREGNLKRVMGGRARFGWADPGKGEAWVVDDTAAKTLREAAERVLRGEPLQAVHNDLTERGLMVDSYGEPVSQKRLRGTLQQPVTAGLMTDRDGKVLGRAAEGPLDVETFERVQDVFSARKRGRPQTEKFPLSRVLRCGKCGNQLTGETSSWRDTLTYRCANPHPGLKVTTPCHGVSIGADAVHDYITDALAAWAVSPRGLAVAREQGSFGPQRTELHAERELWQDRLADLDDKRDDNLISAARYVEREARIKGELARVDIELAAVDTAEQNPVPVDIEWDKLTADEKRRRVEKVFITPLVVQPTGRTRGSAEERMHSTGHKQVEFRP